MKTIKFIGYLFYRYYAKGPRASIPYFSSLCSMTLLGFMHLMQIFILLNKFDILPNISTNDKTTKRIVILFVMVLIYLLMTMLFKKRDIEPLKDKYEYNRDKIFIGNVRLIVYFIFSFALIVVLAVWKQH